ncbi:MAG: NosD domain-containing protein, partial [Planctomycetota bacterium]
MTAFVFTNNTIRNNEGAVALRGCQDVGALTSTATITGNTITSMNGNYPGGVADYDGDNVADDLGWAGIEVNHVDTVTLTGNTVSDMRNGYSLFATGAPGDPFDGNYNVGGLGGQSFQIWKVNTLNMSGNTITNNFQGVKIYGSDSTNTDRLIPAGSVTGNTISGNTGFGLMVTDNFNGDAPLD